MKRLRGSVIVVLCFAASACGSGTSGTQGTGGSGGSGGRSGSGGGGGGGGSAGTNVDAAVNGVSCNPFTPCGGNVVGTWRLVSSCGTVSSFPCPASERVAAQSSVTQATYTFAGDGTFTYAASGALTEMLRYPRACLDTNTDAGVAQVCAAIEHAFVSSDGGAVEVTSASCSAAADQTCACTAVLTSTGGPQTTSGTYTTTGNQITLTAASASDGGVRDAGADPASEYCVSGNTLLLHLLSSSSDWVMTLTR